MPLAVTIVIVLAFYSLLVCVGLWVLARLRGRRVWARVVLMVVVLWVVALPVNLVAYQIHMREGRQFAKVRHSYPIWPRLDPLPEPRTRHFAEEWMGPMLMKRKTREDGVAELGGGSQETWYEWSWEPVLAGATGTTILAGGLVGGIVWWKRRRARKRNAAAPAVT